jgi:hypothetical protein
MMDGKYDIDGRLAQLLAATVRLDADATIELTVVVDATIISGSVASRQAWERRQNDQIRVGSPAIADAFASASVAATADEQKLNDDLYVHFLGPVLVTGGRQVRLQATRVDLRKVSAWSIGRMPADQEWHRPSYD